jgi:broad specificity phosphatase PhoE
MEGTAPDPAVTCLVLVRHGEGRVNVERVLAGLRGCTGLTERGLTPAIAAHG